MSDYRLWLAVAAGVGLLLYQFWPSVVGVFNWTRRPATPVAPEAPSREQAFRHVDGLLAYFEATGNASGKAAAAKCGEELFRARSQ